ncbi:MAG TPA: hypothetical protein DHV02_07545 [Neisseriales bacterium]|jgi:rhodanese-related sulfurtransferase|nr:rhodanese-like domain-containing protein [Burkholderiales bacterium]MBP9768285.1 rhodanese-like domain-containing protein [Burkholderiales bacterium]HCY39704.1 hypothetical protein [Neisseriales bacterium]
MSKIEYLDDEQLKSMFPNGVVSDADVLIIDVRSPGENAAEYIEGSTNIPLDELMSFDRNKYKDKTLVFHCKGGVRTKANQHVLESLASKQSFCFDGGIEQWKSCGHPIKK